MGSALTSTSCHNIQKVDGLKLKYNPSKFDQMFNIQIEI